MAQWLLTGLMGLAILGSICLNVCFVRIVRYGGGQRGVTLAYKTKCQLKTLSISPSDICRAFKSQRRLESVESSLHYSIRRSLSDRKSLSTWLPQPVLAVKENVELNTPKCPDRAKEVILTIQTIDAEICSGVQLFV